MDWSLVAAGLIVGVIVGMTGMGGGALMTPILVIFFGIPPLAAVGNDLVVSALTKPVGGLVHLRRGTVNLTLVKWLTIGSVPAGFCGVLIAKALGGGEQVQSVIKTALGIALVIAAASLAVKSYLRMREETRARREGRVLVDETGRPRIDVKPIPTMLIGAVGGLIVGLTSVGAGTLIIIAIMALYPRLQASSLVGTDLVASVPLVVAAALGHVLFGDFHFGITLPLLLGAMPATWVGAMLSSRVPGAVIRRALGIVLLASACKLLGVSNLYTLLAIAAVPVIGWPIWMLARRQQGLRPVSFLGGRPAANARSDEPAAAA